MAWSDAARAAALEARKHHARAVRYYKDKGGSNDKKSAMPHVRKELAASIKLARSGKVPLGHVFTPVDQGAWSTHVRNLGRRK